MFIENPLFTSKKFIRTEGVRKERGTNYTLPLFTENVTSNCLSENPEYSRTKFVIQYTPLSRAESRRLRHNVPTRYIWYICGWISRMLRWVLFKYLLLYRNILRSSDCNAFVYI